VNSSVKNNDLPPILVSLKMLVVLRWLIWRIRLKAEDDPNLCHSVIIARNLGTFQNIVGRNSTIIVRRWVI
jgi:hypothetical protein